MSWCFVFCIPTLFRPATSFYLANQVLHTHLVLGVDESVIDAFRAVAEVEDGVDFLSSIKRFGAGDLAHALVIWELLGAVPCWHSYSTWNSSWERTMQQEVTR